MARTTPSSLVLGLVIAIYGATSTSASADPAPVTSEGLEARLREQDARIRQLEEEVRRLSAQVAQPAPATAQAPSSTNASPPAATAAPAESSSGPTIKLRGRIQVDASAGSGDGMSSGTQVRRAYLGAEGKLGGGFRYLADVDFAGNDVNLQDVLIGYAIDPGTELVVGYFKPSATNDDLTSDVHTLFLERSAYATVFAPGRRVGVGLNHAGKNWGARVGLFGEREDRTLDTDRTEAWLASGRVHADLLPGDDVLHVAVSGYYTKPGSEHAVRITQRPEVNRAPVVLDTGLFGTDRGLFGGAELAFARGPLTMQGEGGALRYRSDLADPLFWGLSVQASWRWTGEARTYDVASGTFGRVTPKRPVSDGGPGAFETGLRFTFVDLDDAGVFGGRLMTYGVVLNWFPMTRVRFSGNFIRADVDRILLSDEKYNLVAIRSAVDW